MYIHFQSSKVNGLGFICGYCLRATEMGKNRVSDFSVSGGPPVPQLFNSLISDSTLNLKAMLTLINYSTVRVGYSRLAESNMYIYWINGIEQIL